LLELLPPGPKKILDVGCGTGGNARILKERGCQVWGVTLSEEEVRSAEPWCESVQIANVEGDDLPFSADTFDVILLSHVLEHMIDPHNTLIRLSRYLKEGGLLLAAVPNMAFWRMRWQFLLGNWERDDAGFMDRTHLQFWSYTTVSKLLEETPYSLRQLHAGDPALPLWPLRRLLPGWCKRIDNCVGPLLANLSAIQVLIVAEKSTQG
jgi:SAM-dependent methyltransferase